MELVHIVGIAFFSLVIVSLVIATREVEASHKNNMIKMRIGR